MTLRDVAQELVALANSAVPFETCGFILKNWTWIECSNVALDPMRGFEFSEEDLVKYLPMYKDQILGIFHTHPRGTSRPSEHDSEFPYPAFRYFIATPTDMYEWSFKDGREPRPVDPATGTVGAANLAYPILAGPVTVRPGFGDVAQDGS